ncbi:hypothetical protein HDU97_007611 [Phlyctochytrium planicorne]|nr:hypothetical protein HDU97_007611 [Phlyctochytrium planicorne]
MRIPSEMPLEVLEQILEWTEDHTVAIKTESMLLRIPSKLPPYSSAFSSFALSDFPICARLTSQFNLLPTDIDASTISLSTIAWLIRFRPEIFWRQSGWLTSELAMQGRLEALALIASDEIARTHAFGWINLDSIAEKGHLDVIQFLHEKFGLPTTEKTLGIAARRGSLDMVKYLYEIGSECSENILLSASLSKSADLLRYVLEKHGDKELDGELDLPIEYFPELEELILAKQPQLMTGVILTVAAQGNVDRLKHFVDDLSLTLPDYLDLEAAAVAETLDAAKYLLEDLNRPIRSKALSAAASNGRLETLRYFSEKFRKMMMPSYHINDIASNGHVEVFRYLLETHGRFWMSYTNTSDILNKSFERAAYNGHLEMVQYLYPHCPKLDLKDVMKVTLRNGYLEGIKILFSFWRFKDVDQSLFDGSLNSPDASLEAVRFLYVTGKFDFSEKAVIDVVSRGV